MRIASIRWCRSTDRHFVHDLDPLAAAWPDGYTIEGAGRLAAEIIRRAR